jgi:hypothetical protein
MVLSLDLSLTLTLGYPVSSLGYRGRVSVPWWLVSCVIDMVRAPAAHLQTKNLSVLDFIPHILI